jgi:hypothetical protein
LQKRPSKDITSAKSQTTLQGIRCDPARQLQKHRRPQLPFLLQPPHLLRREQIQMPCDQRPRRRRRHYQMRHYHHVPYPPPLCRSERDLSLSTLLLRLVLACISQDSQGIRVTQVYLRQHAKALVQTDVQHQQSERLHLHHEQHDLVWGLMRPQVVCQGLALFTRFVG